MTRGLNPPDTLSAENVHTLRSVRRDIYYQGIIGGGKLKENQRCQKVHTHAPNNIASGSFGVFVCRLLAIELYFHCELCSHNCIRKYGTLFL